MLGKGRHAEILFITKLIIINHATTIFGSGNMIIVCFPIMISIALFYRMIVVVVIVVGIISVMAIILGSIAILLMMSFKCEDLLHFFFFPKA